CRKQVAALNPELFAVRLVLKEVEKFKTDEAYASLSNQDLQDLEQKVAPLVHFDDPDIMALRFDSFMYGFMLDLLDGTQRVDRDSSTLVKTVRALQKLKNIPQVADQLPLLEQIDCEAFWQNLSASTLEDVRRKLRPLIQFLDRESKAVIITNLYDPVVRSGEGKPLPVMDEFESYEQKVNRYIEEHRDTEAIRKLTQNIPLTQQDYEELERIFTQELGSREQYKKAFSDTPFGLLVRKIAKLDHDAAFDAFSEFINDESLNSRQIEFVKKIILYIEQNGYIDNPSILREPPFDKPFRIFDFDHVHLQRLMHVITSIKQNALWQCA
ncbi:MAG: type I restriction-modification enzyme R subunit C-terminal domain-containing protein, partial [Desulfovibrionaceae bacterium]|nr:type I restriction-modification enzyme R subunit C-terminal domain-containing protein [Desulfovibrionaceae bacterium]